MRTVQQVIFAIMFLVASAITVNASTNLLKGLTYYEGKEKLTGKIVFQLQDGGPHNGEILETNSKTDASIYEFDLQNQQLKKVSASPEGYYFIAPDHGDVYCVVYGPFDSNGASYTNVFVYSDLFQRKRSLTLDKTPTTTSIANGHVFFEFGMSFDRENHRLLDYDVALDRIQPAELSNPTWQKLDKARYEAPKAFNNRYIFFAGNDAPSEGYTLVSSLGDDFETKDEPKGKDVKVLHTFSRLATLETLLGNEYLLVQLSPDGRYALIRLQSESPFKTKDAEEDSAGWVNEYYLVDVLNGKTRLLLKDEVGLKSPKSILGLHWVDGTK